MSTQPPNKPSDSDLQPMTLPRIAEMKRAGEPIVMITAYDYPSAQIVEEAGVDIVLVGDTAAMVVLGYDATTPVGMEEMLMMAVGRPAGPESPAADRRHALRLIREIQRAGDRERPALRQGGRLRMRSSSSAVGHRSIGRARSSAPASL